MRSDCSKPAYRRCAMRRNRRASCSDGVCNRARDISMLRTILILAAVLPGMPSFAADLVSIYRDAQSADAVYAGARETYVAGQEKLPQGLSGLLPAVTLSAN